MRGVKGIAIAALILAALPWASARAGVHWSVGLNLGVPAYYGYGPYWGRPYPYYYYRPYPVYVAPPAVVVQSAPVYQSVPVVQPAYSSPAEAAPTPLPAPTAVQPTALVLDPVEQQMQQLNAADDQARAAAAVQLGRLKAKRAVQPLEQMLTSDRSATVREAAARALGLIDDTASLPALQRAAQADDDHDVRHSAQFAAEVIRSNMQR